MKNTPMSAYLDNPRSLFNLDGLTSDQFWREEKTEVSDKTITVVGKRAFVNEDIDVDRSFKNG